MTVPIAWAMQEEVESLLKGSGQLRALALLYESKGLRSSALEIWQKIVEDNAIEPNVPTGIREDETAVATLSVSKLSAASEAARLLEATSDSTLVMQHLRWVLKVDMELGMRILSSMKRPVPLPPENVLKILRLEETVIYERYLQWLVLDQGSQDASYHTEFAILLAKISLRAINEGDLQGRPLKTMSEVRERLQDFLSMSNFYDSDAVLAKIDNTELWREQAILYKKRGDEILALRILALKLEDSDAAEKYCAELGRPNAYMQLLDMYLKPDEGKDAMYGPAVRLLHSHCASLDPLQVLEALSPDMPLQLACQTLARMLQARVHYHRERQIVRNLSRAINLESRIARVEEKSRHVQITDKSLCDSCGSSIGTKLFALYPNDVVACFKCLRRSGDFICPVTGHNFEAFPFEQGFNEHQH